MSRRTSDDHRFTKPPDWRDILSVGRMGRPQRNAWSGRDRMARHVRALGAEKYEPHNIAHDLVFKERFFITNAEKHNPEVRRGSPQRRSSRSLSQAAPPFLSVGAHGQPRARLPDLVSSRFPSPYHFPARIQSFQAVAAPFPGDSVLSSRPLEPRSRRPKRPQFKGSRSARLRSLGAEAMLYHCNMRELIENEMRFGKQGIKCSRPSPTSPEASPRE